MGGIERLVVEITSDVNQAEAGFGKVSSALMNLTNPATLATAAIGAFTAAIGVSIREAALGERAVAQLEAVLRSTGEAAGVTSEMAQELALSLSHLSGVGDDTILSAENILLTFTAIKDDIFPDVTRTALDLSVAFGMNMQQSAIMLGKALQDPIAGLSAMRRVGVSFSETQVNMITRMVEHGQVARAQGMILEEVSRQVGGSAEAMGNTFQGAWGRLTQILGEFAGEVGDIFLPTVTKALNGLVELLTRLFDALGPGFERSQRAFSALGEAFESPQMRRALEDLAQVLIRLAADVMPQFARVSQDMVFMFAAAIQAYGPMILGTITRILNLIDRMVEAAAKVRAAAAVVSAVGVGMNSSSMGRLPGFQHGGFLPSGGVGIVGETEPEMIMAGRGGVRIVPMSQSYNTDRSMNFYGARFNVPNRGTLRGLIDEAAGAM